MAHTQRRKRFSSPRFGEELSNGWVIKIDFVLVLSLCFTSPCFLSSVTPYLPALRVSVCHIRSLLAISEAHKKCYHGHKCRMNAKITFDLFVIIMEFFKGERVVVRAYKNYEPCCGLFMSCWRPTCQSWHFLTPSQIPTKFLTKNVFPRNYFFAEITLPCGWTFQSSKKWFHDLTWAFLWWAMWQN